MAGEVVQLMGLVLCAMRHEFNNEDNRPLGGLTGEPQHRGGLLIPIDGFPESPSEEDCAVMAFTNVLRRWKTTNFPGESGDVRPCGGSKAVLIQIGVARCSMAMDENGEPPPAERTEREALVLLDDSDRMDRVMCRVVKLAEEANLIDSAVVHAWEPLGPEGGILTGLLTASFQLSS